MLKLRDIMTRDVVVVSSDTPLRGAMELFAKHHITGAPVVDGDAVVGVVSATDLLTFAATLTAPGPAPAAESQATKPWDEAAQPEEAELTGFDAGNEPAAAYFTELWSEIEPDVASQLEEGEVGIRDLLGGHTVDEVMTREVCALSPSTAVTAAADYMQRADVHRLLVLSGATLEGIVTTMDITRAVAEDKLTSRRYVFTDGARLPAEYRK
jgi:CBS domain-containing protein